ncbi:MAG: D-sedoheptulose-7-phosphate isomerase [Gemmatimonadota bacterium]
MSERSSDTARGRVSAQSSDRGPAPALGRQGILGPHLSALAGLAREVERTLAEDVERYAAWAASALRDGGTLFFAGNGGSAATAEHVAAEYAIRFRRERPPLPAVALTAGSSALTAAANDFGFQEVFARPLRGRARTGDLLVLHSTSGRSRNVIRAAEVAAGLDVGTVGMLAGDGGALAQLVDLPIVVPTRSTARAQEIHLALEHAVADRIDAVFAVGGGEEDMESRVGSGP